MYIYSEHKSQNNLRNGKHNRNRNRGFLKAQKRSITHVGVNSYHLIASVIIICQCHRLLYHHTNNDPDDYRATAAQLSKVV